MFTYFHGHPMRGGDTYGKLYGALAQDQILHASIKRREGITYSTEKDKGSYPYCDRRRICDSSLDGHLEKDASFGPRKFKRLGVTWRSRPL